MLNIFNQQNQNTEESKPAAAALPVKPPAHVDFRKYQDPTGELRSQELSRGIWYVKHRMLLYRLAIVSLLVTAGLLWFYSVGSWIAFFANWQQADQVSKSLARFPNYTGLHEHFAPQQLQVLGTQLLPGGVNKYDAVAEVANPNELFRAEIEYHFLLNGVPTESRRTVLLAGEIRPVAELGLSGIDLSGAVDFQISNINWTRISRHAIALPLEWQAERLAFTIASTTFSPGQASIDSPKVNIITFNLTNPTPYGYIEPSWYVGLFSGDTMVGIMPLTLRQLQALETASVDLRNFVTNLNVSDIKLFPLINLYDPAAYLPPS